MRGVLGVLVGPLLRGLTYRRAVHLLLGAVVLLPYLALGQVFAAAAEPGQVDPLALVLLVVPTVAVAAAVLLVPGVRALAVTAARALLGSDLPDPDLATARAWPARRRAAVWVLVNMMVGGAVAVGLLFALPTAVGLLLAPWVPARPLPSGAAAAWTPPAALALLAASGYLVAAGGALLARLAPRLLGPGADELLVAELARSRVLAERNRLARELHDSVGHALTVTTVQAGAAARILDTDPQFARRALEAIAETGRTALDELDHVLGLLREDTEEKRFAPGADLAELDALLAGARSAGIPVHAELSGAVESLPPVVSREAYRIVQEALTNALRHAGTVPVAVRVVVGAELVELEIRNPLGAQSDRRVGRGWGRRGSGGRGLAGMRERIGVLHGELAAGVDGPDWRVVARLPLGPAAEAP